MPRAAVTDRGQARTPKHRRHALASLPAVCFSHPDWIEPFVDWGRRYASDLEKMRLAIALAAENVAQGTGGPFGAAIFERRSGALVAVGVNDVARLNNCVLHAEMVAIMTAQARLGSYTLRGQHGHPYEMVSSCEPCAMCLGALLWSGLTRVVTGAHGDDARRIGFEEGPVFPASYEYLETHGIELVRGVLREEAVVPLESYLRLQGIVYNG